MKPVFIAVFVLFSCALSAQTDTIPKWQYMELAYTKGTTFIKQYVDIRTGGDPTGVTQKRKLALDEKGEPIKFGSAIEALNYFGGIGWELVTMYEDKEDMMRFQHYILKKRL